jgi:glycerol-3-phosphate dehydrogenase
MSTNFSTMPAANRPLVDDVPVSRVQLMRAARYEMAMSLSDTIFRRTSLRLSQMLNDTILLECVELMKRELRWSESQAAAQVALSRTALKQAAAWRVQR